MTQCERVINYIKLYGFITSYEAFKDLGITRLAARVSDLRKGGYNIVSHDIFETNCYGDKVRYARYTLADE